MPFEVRGGRDRNSTLLLSEKALISPWNLPEGHYDIINFSLHPASFEFPCLNIKDLLANTSRLSPLRIFSYFMLTL